MERGYLERWIALIHGDNMKAKSAVVGTISPNTVATCFRTACVSRILPMLLFLALPAAVQAQFNYTTNNGTITITGYTGPAVR